MLNKVSFCSIGTCQTCGSVGYLEEGRCMWCEETKEIRPPKTAGNCQQSGDCCEKCGTKKKLVDLFTSRFWGCPKC